MRRRVFFASACFASCSGVVLGALLAHDMPIAGSPRVATAIVAAVSAPLSALLATAVLFSVQPGNRFGFWRGVGAGLLAWPLFCVFLAAFAHLTESTHGWTYGAAVFLFGIAFGIAPALVLLGGVLGWIVGCRVAAD